MPVATKHVTQKSLKKEMKKVHLKFKEHDEEFKSVHRLLGAMDRRITGLRIEMHEGFSQVRSEMREMNGQISALISEIRQDRLETHQLRTRVTVLEEKVN